MKKLFEGSGVALVTPFKDGKVNYEKLGELIEWHIANKTDSIIVCGTTGESATMTDEERNAIVLYRMENARRTLNEIADHCERGYWNTAINRMYYACFYAASALLVANKIVVKSHEGVRQMLGKHFVLTGQLSVGMGKFYTLIFNKRSSGDYEDFINHDQKTVDELYPYALTFINSIDELLKR